MNLNQPCFLCFIFTLLLHLPLLSSNSSNSSEIPRSPAFESPSICSSSPFLPLFQTASSSINCHLNIFERGVVDTRSRLPFASLHSWWGLPGDSRSSVIIDLHSSPSTSKIQAWIGSTEQEVMQRIEAFTEQQPQTNAPSIRPPSPSAPLQNVLQLYLTFGTLKNLTKGFVKHMEKLVAFYSFHCFHMPHM